MSQDYSGIQGAVKLLAAVCDGAVAADSVGFNGTDTDYGHRMAKMPIADWTRQDAHEAGRMLRKYRHQLASRGVDYDSLEIPELDDNEDEEVVKAEARQKARNFAKRPYIQIDSGVVSVFNSYELRGGLYRAGFKFNRRSGKDAAWVGTFSSQSAQYLLHEPKLTLSDEQRAELLTHYDTSGIDDVVMAEPDVYDIDTEGSKLLIAVPWGRVPLSVIQALPGRKYGGGAEHHGNKINYMSPSRDVLDMVSKFKLTISPDAEKLIAVETARVDSALAESTATDTTMSVALDDVMRPYQKAGSAYMVRHGAAINADDMGLGKTIQSLSAIETIHAYPCVIVCPASLKLNWHHEIQRWLPHRTVAIVEGRNGDKANADFVIVNYDILAANLEYESKVVKGRNGKPKTEIVFTGLGNLPDPKSFILDESHYIKEETSRRTKAAKYFGARVPKGNPVFCLTGTPILNRPKELVQQLLLLGYLKQDKNMPGDMMTVGQFLFRYCGPKNEGYGWTFNGSTNKSELAQWLRTTCMVRRVSDDVLTELPKLQRSQQFMELDSKARLNYSYLVDEAREYASKTAAEQLVFLTKVKQAIGLAKVDGAIAWADDFLATGKQLIVFAYSADVQRKLIEGLRGLGHEVTHILGGQSARVTEEQKASFRLGISNVIVCSIKAAREGHTLIAADTSFTVELNWTPGEHNQCEKRNHRIGQERPVTAYYYLADNTIDNYLFDMVEGKRGVIDAIVDGGDDTDNASTLRELIEYMTGE